MALLGAIGPVIAACWIVFILVWAASALFTKRAVYAETNLERLKYILLIMAGVVLFMISIPAPSSVHPFSNVIIASGEREIVGTIFAVLGLIVLLWARFTLGTNWSGNITLKKNHELITTGPYAYVRHPIYTGLILLFFGTAVDVGTIGVFLATILIFVSFWIKLLQEEGLMKKEFGKKYADYMLRVKALIPGIF